MEAELGTVQPQELLTHVGWARSLASVLVHEPSDLDDLVQSTLLAALTRPPRKGRPVRPWLATVMRNFARDRVRGARRREAREIDRGPLAEGAPSADELAMRVELQRLLADLLLGLPEELRSTLVLRFYEDLSSAEIARRTDTPAGTVRWRLKRGLDLLRERLDERHDGDRRAWIAALTPLLSPEEAALGASAGGTVTFTGALMMIVTHKVFLTLVSLAALLFGMNSTGWLEPGAASAPGVTSSEVEAAAVAAAEPEPDPEDEPETVVAAPEAVEQRVAIEVAPASITLPIPGLPMTRMQMRFVDSHGAPLAGVRLDVSVDGISAESLRTGESLLGYPEQLAAMLDPSMFGTASDGTGRAYLESNLLDQPRTVSLTAEGHDRAYWEYERVVEPGDEVDLGDVVLAPAGVIVGRVVDKEGRPVAAAQVQANPAWSGVFGDVGRPRGKIYAKAKTNNAGEFRLRGISPGSRRVWAYSAKSAWAWTEPCEVLGGEEFTGIELVLHPRKKTTPYVNVRVLTPDGEPASAFVRAHMGGGWVESNGTNSEGRVRFGHTRSIETIETLLAVDSNGELGYAIARDVAPADEEIELVLGGSVEVPVQVEDPSGEPIEGYLAEVIDQVIDRVTMPYSKSEGPHAGGRATLRATELDSTVRVTAPGYLVAEVGPMDLTTFTDRAPVKVVLFRAAACRGTVFAGGNALSGADVDLLRVTSPEQLVVHNEFPTRFDPGAVASAVTDAEGRFRFDVHEAGRFALRARHAEWPDALLAEVELDPKVGKEGLEIHMQSGGRLEGVYAPLSGASAIDVIIGVTRGSGDARTTRTGLDGRFEFDELAPGAWYVAVRATETTPQLNAWVSRPASTTWEHPFNCEIRPGETTRMTLRDDSFVDTRIRGRITLGGEGPAGGTVRLKPTGDDPFDDRLDVAAELDLTGAFEIAGRLRTGAYDLVLSGPGSEGFLVTKPVVIEEDEQYLDLALESGSVAGSVSASRPDEPTFVWKGQDGLRFSRPIRLDQPLVEQLGRVPAGQARIVDPGPRDGDRWEWPLVMELVVAPEGTTTIAIP